MSCHGCAESFGFLKKEAGCPSCGYSFCKKCLRFQTTNDSGKTSLVCRRCHELTQTEKSSMLKALHELESLENPTIRPITVYMEPTTRLGKLKRGLSVEDQKIVERLESLRRDKIETTETGGRRNSDQPEEDLARRLAILKGEDPDLVNVKVSANIFPTPKAETEHDLITRLSEQVALDKVYNQQMVIDIEERLAKLRQGQVVDEKSNQQGATGSSRANQFSPDMEGDDEDEAEQVRKLIDRFKEEVALERDNPPAVSSVDDSGKMEHEQSFVESEDEDDVDPDKLCRICDEKRATLKCADCDDDIFCQSCFREFHIELGEQHKPTVI